MQQQLALDGSEGSLNPPPKLRLPEEISLTPEQEDRPQSYYQRHRADRLEYARCHYQKHRTSRIGSRKIKTDRERKESQRLACRRYRIRHHAKRQAKWRSPEKKKKQAAYLKEWLNRNPQKKVEKRKACIAYHKKRYHSDPCFCLSNRLRGNIRKAFHRTGIRKRSKSMVFLGCSIDQAKAHIEGQFVTGMSWEIPNSFHIDHLIPVSAFDLSDLEEARLAFNWRNLQPLTPHSNSVKHATLPNPLPSWLPLPIATRILRRMSK